MWHTHKRIESKQNEIKRTESHPSIWFCFISIDCFSLFCCVSCRTRFAFLCASKRWIFVCNAIIFFSISSSCDCSVLSSAETNAFSKSNWNWKNWEYLDHFELISCFFCYFFVNFVLALKLTSRSTSSSCRCSSDICAFMSRAFRNTSICCFFNWAICFSSKFFFILTVKWLLGFCLPATVP